MLTSIRLRAYFLLTLIAPAVAERIFHNRDHSDVLIPASHQAELIIDKGSAQQFLVKYGFMRPRSWEESQSDTAPVPAAASTAPSDMTPLIQEGDSGSRAGKESTSKDPAENPTFVLALRDFQKVSGLRVTGVLDDATKAAMNKPRCGVPDKAFDSNVTAAANATDTRLNQTLFISTTSASATRGLDSTHGQDGPTGSLGPERRKRFLEALLFRKRRRRDLTGAGQVGFSKKVLKWRLMGEGYSSQLSIDEQRYVFKLAFRMWSEVCPVEFEEDLTSPLFEIDVRLGFGTGRHLGCAQSFDGAGREFAHAWFLGDIHFDDDEHFTAPSGGNGISLLKVAVHEIGHVLGLPHIYRGGSIMQPSYVPQDSAFEIDWMDRKAIQQLYGGCKGRFNTVFDWVRKERTPYGELVIRFNTYFIRDSWYWLYENRSNRTRYGDPIALQVGWHGIPSDGVDAYVHVWDWRTDAAYFFKGTQYWRYDSENDQVYTQDSEGQRYPRLISEGFPGIPSPINTAFYNRRDSRIYFFKDLHVYSFDVRTNKKVNGFPMRIMDVFPAVMPGDHPIGNLDAAYFSYTHNSIFFLKGTHFWKVVSSQDRRQNPSLPYNGVLPRKDIDSHWFDICNVHMSTLKMTL